MQTTKRYDYMIRSGKLDYQIDGKILTVPIVMGVRPKFKQGELQAYCSLSAENGGLRARVEVDNDTGLPIYIEQVRLETSISLPLDTNFFCNGYQSQSFSALTNISRGMKSRPFLCSPKKKKAGDYNFTRYRAKQAHSWTFSYFDSPIGQTLLASLDETVAYTRIDFHRDHNRSFVAVSIEKDCEGLYYGPVSRLAGTNPEPLCPLDVFLTTGSIEDCWKNYFELFYSVHKKRNLFNRSRPAVIWDNRYAMMEKVAASSLLSIAKEYSLLNIPLDYFLIGGYEENFSDWLEPGEGFPLGMEDFTEKIRELGFVPGISFSPFVCSSSSRIYLERRELLLKDRRGRPVKIKRKSRQEYDLYVLDIYNEEARRYIRRCLRTFVKNWGVGIIRADYLFAASLCSYPYKDKTRAQAMEDGAALLRQGLDQHRDRGGGRVPVIANAIPLAQAFGRFEYCSVAADMSMAWDKKTRISCRGFLREASGTKRGLISAIGRRYLNGRAFSSDLGSVILRKYGDKMNEKEQLGLLNITRIFSGIFSVSDSIGAFNSQTLNLFLKSISAFPTRGLEIQEELKPVSREPLVASYEYQGSLVEEELDLIKIQDLFF